MVLECEETHQCQSEHARISKEDNTQDMMRIVVILIWEENTGLDHRDKTDETIEKAMNTKGKQE